MSKPEISVIIANYNRADMIEASLESVLNQDFDRFEVIVSDDGSTDHSLKVIEKFKDRITVVTGYNGGCALARTRGIFIARGEFIAIHDSDDIMLQGRLQAQSQFMKKHHDVAAVTGNLVMSNDESRNYLRTVGVDFKDKSHVIFDRPIKIFANRSIMADPATMLRKRVFETVGGYDCALPVSADWDLWLRIARRWSMGCMDTPCTWYRVHDGNKSASPLRIATLIRIMEKNLSSKDRLEDDAHKLLTERLYNTLIEYVRINTNRPFDEDWRGRVRFHARHLPRQKRGILCTLSAVPKSVAKAGIDNKKAIRTFLSRFL